MAVIVSKELKVPMVGRQLGDFAIGEIVKLNENGTPAEYMVVHQGNPNSSLYDSSCDETWLLRKDIYEKRVWNSSNNNDYANSTIHSYLNNTFIALFDADTKAAIVQAKIPYRPNSGTGTTINNGSSGLSVKIFLLSANEVGYGTGYGDGTPNFSKEGKKLSYFNETVYSNTKGVGYLNGTAIAWWLRSPYCGTDANVSVGLVNHDGSWAAMQPTYSYGVRPALIMPKTTLFDEKTLLFRRLV